MFNPTVGDILSRGTPAGWLFRLKMFLEFSRRVVFPAPSSPIINNWISSRVKSHFTIPAMRENMLGCLEIEPRLKIQSQCC